MTLLTRNESMTKWFPLSLTIGKHFSCSKGETKLNQALPKSHPKSKAEPMYAECEGGIANSGVAMEENPAYQSVGNVQ